MLKFADFCAGIGGFWLGLTKLGWECVYSCEIDDACEEVYKANFGQKFDAKNLFEVNPVELPDFDIFCAGFPCQPFSIAGKRLGFEDERGSVLFKLLTIIFYKQPSVLILENVANFVSHDAGKTLQLLLKRLDSFGYEVHYKILDSAFFGIPQHRKRLYITGFFMSDA